MASEVRRKDPKCEQAEQLAAQCYFLVDFYEERFNDPEYSRLASIDRDAIGQALAQCHVAGLKMAYRDLREEIEDLLPGDQAELKHRLDALFSSDLDLESRQELLRTQQIVRTGRISSQDDYAVLRGYLEHNADRWGSSTFVRRATEIVAEYEQQMD